MVEPAESETLRAFVALEIDEECARVLARTADRLQTARGAAHASWTPSPKLHVTLRFFDKLETAHVSPLAEALASLAGAETEPPPGAWTLDAFPSADRARVIVARLADPGGRLAELAKRIESVVTAMGIAPEAREFRPHVTLARLRRPAAVRDWLATPLGIRPAPCRMRRLTLLRSVLSAQGSIYSPLASYELAGGGASRS